MHRPTRPRINLVGAAAVLAFAASPCRAAGTEGSAGSGSLSAAGFLAVLGLALAAAKLGALAAAKLRQPPVLGELLAGVLVGPFVLGRLSALHLDPGTQTFHLLAEVGVVLLLFEIGLETDLGKMLGAGLSAALVALIGIALPFLLGFASVWALASLGWIAVPSELRSLLGIFLGATLTATSVGITARVLRDLGRMGSIESRILIGAAVIDDVIGLVILALVTGVGATAAAGLPFSHAIAPGLIAGKLGVAILFLVGSIIIGRALAPRLFDAVSMLEARGLLVTATLTFVLGLAFVADLVGSAVIIGGFAAGLVLSRTRQSEEIEREMRPVTDVFAPLFFVSVGASIDVARLNPFDTDNRSTLLLTGILLIVAVIGKMAAGLGVVEAGVNRLAVGIGMVPRGEVGLIFAQAGAHVMVVVEGRSQPLLSPALHAAITLTVLLTTLIAPPGLRLAFQRQEKS